MSIPSNVVNMYDPAVPIPQGIYEESTTQLGKIGTRLRVGEKTFFYAKAGTNLTAGNVYCAPTAIQTKMVGSCALFVKATASDANVITITAGTAITANEFAEGHLIVASQALSGGGLCLKIKSHGAISSAGTGTITLYDAIPTATVAAGPINLLNNPFDGVILGSQALGMPVCVAPIAVTSGNYFWAQTWGPAAVRHSAATPAAAVLHMGTLGQVACTFDATTNGGVAGVAYQIGKNVNLAATATQCNPVFLTITP